MWRKNAGKKLAKQYRQSFLKVGYKSRFEPVIRQDKEIERYLRRQIHGKYPKHGIIGEEGTRIGARNGHTWILDPLDGTINYIRGFAYFSVPGNAESSNVARQTRRHIVNRAEATNKLPEFIPQEDRNRGEAVQQTTTGYMLMRGSEGRRLRRYNRTRKPGFDRYRTLNLRTNRRSLRP